MDEKAQSMDWIHEELRDGIENYDIDTSKTFQAPYKSSRFDLMEDLNNSKKKVQ